MFKRSVLTALCLAVVACGGLYLSSLALAADEYSGRYRVVRTNGTVVEGEIKEDGDKYIVTVKKGIIVTVARSEVKVIKKLDEESPKSAAKASKSGDGKDPLDKEGDLSDDEVKKLLGADDLGNDVSSDGDMMPKLDTNEPSVAEMMKIAATQNKLETDHFVLIYTSSSAVARTLAARLEATYRWNFNFIKQMNLTPKRPKFRLEIYFFGDHKEFQAYQSNEGAVEMGVLGYYRPDKNRSVFFDMDTWPPVLNLKEQLKHADPQNRRRIVNIIKRWKEFRNLEVIQHEASHHIHFNVGVFNGDQTAFPPRWLAEGLAMMFELPPTGSGAGLAAVNNYRLNQFQEMYGQSYPRFPIPMRQFFIDDGMWMRVGYTYQLGWAMVNYLYRKYPDKFKKYMAIVGAREEGVEVDMTQKQKEIEDLFGEINEKWVSDFFKFYMDQHVKKSELPPPLFE